MDHFYKSDGSFTQFFDVLFSVPIIVCALLIGFCVSIFGGRRWIEKNTLLDIFSFLDFL